MINLQVELWLIGIAVVNTLLLLLTYHKLSVERESNYKVLTFAFNNAADIFFNLFKDLLASFVIGHTIIYFGIDVSTSLLIVAGLHIALDLLIIMSYIHHGRQNR